MLRFIPRYPKQTQHSTLYPYEGIMEELLLARGIHSAEEAERFLHPEISQLHDPFLLQDMQKACAILAQAKAEKWNVIVYGDYDVDGICATTIMMQALRDYGLCTDYYIPLRAEGYGLNCAAIEKFARQAKVLVTVDLGITNHKEVQYAQSLGMTVIVTDHHALALTDSPADAVINPLLGDYPFRRLCGAGVAFKVAQALLGLDALEHAWDVVAVATICDMVPLLDENRVFVTIGLPFVAQSKRKGMRALLATSGNPAIVDADVVGYRIGPRLNATGRLGDAKLGVQLMLTKSMEEAEKLADELEVLNNERKKLGETLCKEAEEQVKKHDFVRYPMLIIKGQGWHSGVVGIVSGRLCQNYSCPVCVLSETDGVLHGSLRSVKGIHIQKCLQKLDSLLLHYGGHELAAGVTFKSENFDAFFEALQAEVRKVDATCFVPMKEYDVSIHINACTKALWQEFSRLAPFGIGNPSPLFLAEHVRLDERRAVGVDGAHLKLQLRQENSVLSGIAFDKGELATTLPNEVDVVFALNENVLRGTCSMQAVVKALRPVKQAELDGLNKEEQGKEELSIAEALAYWEKFSSTSVQAEAVLSCKWDEMKTHLQEESRGSVLLTQSKANAMRAYLSYDMDLAYYTMADIRCFHTVLCFPSYAKLNRYWRRIYLLDGAYCDEEVRALRERCPEAKIYVLPKGTTDIAKRLDVGDEGYRRIFRVMRQKCFRTPQQIAVESGFTTQQVYVAMQAFSFLGLITYTPSPFSYALLPVDGKCNLEDSFALRVIRT